jgi:hypothetical protein
MTVIWVLVAVGGFTLVAIMAAMYSQMRSLENLSLRPAPGTKPSQEADAWARNNGFEFIANFTSKVGSMNTLISAWQQPHSPRFFCRYIISAGHKTVVSHDLVTIFTSDMGLTTGDSRDGCLFPRPPGSYMQALTGAGLDERWQVHIEMEDFLIKTGGAQLLREPPNFEESFVDAIRKQVSFVRSVPLWPLRAAYWFFVRRYLWRNKSVKVQHEKGMIRLPNKLRGADILRPKDSCL